MPQQPELRATAEAIIAARQVGVVLYVLALIAVVVSVDILFFRHHFTERLIANVGIVLVFAAFGFLIFRGLGRRQE
jgi:predicted cobalt transporter CbtA